MTVLLHGRVVIDATRQYRRIRNKKIATGIDKVDLAYIKQYQAQAVALLRLKNRWYVLNKKDSAIVFRKILQNISLSKFEIISYCSRSYLPSTKETTILINTSHSGLEQLGYSQKAKQLFDKIVYFLHDIIPLEYPEYCKEGELSKHQQRIQTIVKSGDLVIANSDDTLSKFTYYTQDMTRSAGLRSTVALLGTESIQSYPNFKNPIITQSPYFVILGTIEPRKNHLLLLQVWRKLAEILKEQCPKLYIVGKRGWDIEQVVDILERAPYAQSTVIEVSNACDQQVTQLLKHATALLFPSFVEGFGLPLVQALQLGTPVIASDLAVFKELAGDIPDYADPVDVMRWMELIKNYADQKNDLRLAQLDRMAQFHAFTWEEHFNIVTPKINALFAC